METKKETTVLWTPASPQATPGSNEEIHEGDLPACCARAARVTLGTEPFECQGCGAMWEPTDGGDGGELDDEDFGPTDWSDSDLKAFALDHLEEQFAEARYLEGRPPPAAEYLRWHAAAVPELNEPEMPEDVQTELWIRLAAAAIRIAIDDRTYAFWRNLGTPEKKAAARERRRVSREASVRWRDSGFTDEGAFQEMAAAIEGVHAERQVPPGS